MQPHILPFILQLPQLLTKKSSSSLKSSQIKSSKFVTLLLNPKIETGKTSNGFLNFARIQHAPAFDDSALIDHLSQKILEDYDAVTVAKEVLYESSERNLTWLNSWKLTRDMPSWKNYESAIEMLENHEKFYICTF